MSRIRSLDVPLYQLPALVNLYGNLQKTRIALGNTIWALNEAGKETKDLITILGKVEEIEDETDKRLKKCIHNHPLWGYWLKNIGGVGEILSAQLIHLITGKKHTEECKKLQEIYFSKKERGEKRAKRFVCDCPVMEIERFDNVSALWKYALGGVVEGKAQRRRKGEKITWNPRLRSVCYNLGKSFVMTTSGQYRPFYEQNKAFYNLKDPQLSDGHRDARARRKTVELFLSHLFEVWYTLKGLTPPKTYAEDKLGHVHHIPPPEFKKERKEGEEAEKEEKLDKK